MDRPIFIDIDGTLTTTPSRPWGPTIAARLNRVRDLLAAGQQVVVWSGNGTAYATQFVEKHGLEGAVSIGKPELVVDDNPDIRPRERMQILSPEEFFDTSST